MRLINGGGGPERPGSSDPPVSLRQQLATLYPIAIDWLFWDAHLNPSSSTQADSSFTRLQLDLFRKQNPLYKHPSDALLFGDFSTPENIPSINIAELKYTGDGRKVSGPEGEDQHFSLRLGLAVSPLIAYYNRRSDRTYKEAADLTQSPLEHANKLKEAKHFIDQAKLFTAHSAPHLPLPATKTEYEYVERWLAYYLHQKTKEQNPVINTENAGRLLRSSVLKLPA